MALLSPVNNYPAPTRHQFSGEGSYLVATQVGISGGAVGTGLTTVAAMTAFSETTSSSILFYIENDEPASGGRSLYVDYIKLISTAVGTAAVSWQVAASLDVTPRTPSTNHTSVVVPVCPNSQAANISSPKILAQSSATASTWGAPSSGGRIAGRSALGGVNIAGHEYIVSFGDLSTAAPYVGSTDTAAAPGRSGSALPAIVLGPGGHNLAFHLWGPSSSASLAPEFEIGMWLR